MAMVRVLLQVWLPFCGRFVDDRQQLLVAYGIQYGINKAVAQTSRTTEHAGRAQHLQLGNQLAAALG